VYFIPVYESAIFCAFKCADPTSRKLSYFYANRVVVIYYGPSLFSECIRVRVRVKLGVKNSNETNKHRLLVCGANCIQF